MNYLVLKFRKLTGLFEKKVYILYTCLYLYIYLKNTKL